jgi:hypothetical protein
MTSSPPHLSSLVTRLTPRTRQTSTCFPCCFQTDPSLLFRPSAGKTRNGPSSWPHHSHCKGDSKVAERSSYAFAGSFATLCWIWRLFAPWYDRKFPHAFAAPGISATPHEDNLRYFNVVMEGPQSSPYEGTFNCTESSAYMPRKVESSAWSCSWGRSIPCSLRRSVFSPRSTTPTSTSSAASALTF